MPRPRRPFIPLLVALFLLAAVRPASAEGTVSSSAPRDKEIAYLENLPESNPYRSILLRYQTLPKEERDALRTWANGDVEEGSPPPTLSSEQTDLAREFTAAIVAARTQPPTSHDDWPLLPDPEDPDNPAAIAFPNVGNLRALAQIAVKNASSLPPGEAIDIYAAVAQLARQQRSGKTLIEQLVGVAIEGIAQAEIATRLNQFSPEELHRLSATWSQLRTRPSNAEALSGEREVFFRPWVENILLPGLKALLEDPNAGLEQDGSATSADFTRDIRLSGLMDLGEGRHRIVFENTRTGEFIPLDLGRPADGLELVSLDYDKRVAVIRRDRHEALVHLESKRIVPRKNPAIALRKMFETLELFSETKSGKASLEKLLEIARAHPGGAEGYAKDLFADYQTHLERHLELAESAAAPQAGEVPALTNDPFLEMSMPAIGKVARTLNSSAVQTRMLHAAIRRRLLELNPGASPAPVPDPWADNDEDFAFKPAEDGAGFLLTSRYEVGPGQPVVYKFAAPGAGFIRVSPKP